MFSAPVAAARIHKLAFVTRPGELNGPRHDMCWVLVAQISAGRSSKVLDGERERERERE